MIAIKSILVATDFGETANTALRYGQSLARHFGARLHAVHVVDNIVLKNVGADGFVGILPELQQEVEDAARKQLAETLTTVECGDDVRPQAVVLTSNSPADAIISYAAEAGIDLIVLGTHGREGLKRWLLGSVAERVVRTAACPVLTVHQPEHEFVQTDAPGTTAAA